MNGQGIILFLLLVSVPRGLHGKFISSEEKSFNLLVENLINDKMELWSSKKELGMKKLKLEIRKMKLAIGEKDNKINQLEAKLDDHIHAYESDMQEKKLELLTKDADIFELKQETVRNSEEVKSLAQVCKHTLDQQQATESLTGDLILHQKTTEEGHTKRVEDLHRQSQKTSEEDQTTRVEDLHRQSQKTPEEDQTTRVEDLHRQSQNTSEEDQTTRVEDLHSLKKSKGGNTKKEDNSLIDQYTTEASQITNTDQYKHQDFQQLMNNKGPVSTQMIAEDAETGNPHSFIKKRVSSSTSIVAFHVSKSQSVTPSTDLTLIYDNELLDTQNAYNPQDGIYIVPESGIYVLTWTTLSQNAYIQTLLIVNGVIRGRSWSNSDAGSQDHSSTGIVVNQLSAGDHMFIRISMTHTATGYVESNTDWEQPSFSGWKLN